MPSFNPQQFGKAIKQTFGIGQYGPQNIKLNTPYAIPKTGLPYEVDKAGNPVPQGQISGPPPVLSNMMNVLSQAVGAKAAVKVGANLVQNISRSIQGKPLKTLYKKGQYKALIKDLAGIGTLGTTALGALSGLGVSVGEQAAQPGTSTVTGGIAKEWEKLGASKDAAESLLKGLHTQEIISRFLIK